MTAMIPRVSPHARSFRLLTNAQGHRCPQYRQVEGTAHYECTHGRVVLASDYLAALPQDGERR